ncbi:pilus assembly protein PilZ [Saccharobesus litoralis]|uniref:Pilus assembly protein PilZ n=1 Tax=Saccharobesus litoralis TaxID=2172099 RepID=A0A2S0VP56_9ALTE|nr:PilZ domain-containing protein [Saccharobesus litoralis]AWB65973.1 pilus assembly protein PilZ [Saccharobesus litoralis]
MEAIPLEFRSVQDLYKSYMAFLPEGGLFIETSRQYEMEYELELDVLVPNAIDSLKVTGKVCWINPVSASSATPQGIGVVFTEDKQHLKDRIETMLGGLLNSSEPTFTM